MHGDGGPLVVAGPPEYEREEEEERQEGADEPHPVPPPLGDPRAGAVPVVVVHEEPFLLDGRLPHPRFPPGCAAAGGRRGVEGRGRRRLVVVARGLHVVSRHAEGRLRVRLRVAVRLLHRRGGGACVVGGGERRGVVRVHPALCSV
jgi:hypothetical protein